MFKQKVEVNHNGKWHTVTPVEVEGKGLDHVNQIYFKMSDLNTPSPAPASPAPYGMVRPVNLMMVEADSPNVKISKITYGVLDNDGDLVDLCPDEEELERRYEQLYTKTDGYHLVEITKI
jgi:hypothetical protein